VSTPRRIQRKRTAGWRMPEDAVYVGRPGLWGNPFWVVEKDHGVQLSLTLFGDMARGYWDPSPLAAFSDDEVRDLYDKRAAWLKRVGSHPRDAAHLLRGHDLACWCPLDQPCHADVLLEIANGGNR
jgi:hypothetical protein